LLVTDLAFHITDAASWIERWIWRINGVYRKLGPTLLLRLGLLPEPGAGRHSSVLSAALVRGA